MKRGAVLLFLVACSSAAKDPDPASPPLDLEGAYTSDVDELQFASDATYRYRPESCEAEDCEEVGTYAFDEASQEIRLSSHDVTYALPLADAELETITDDEESIKPANLINGPSKLLTKRSRLLRGRIANRSYVRQQGGCSPAQIKNAQASCNAKCPNGSKGLNYCTPSNYSCACKGGAQPTKDNSCASYQQSWLACANSYSRCPSVTLNCNADFVYNAPEGCRMPRHACNH